MAEEKIYTIPLRREWQKVPIYKRSAKAVRAAKQFLKQHLKEEVKLGPYLNEFIWGKGNRHPPPRVKVRVEEEDKKLIAELINAPRKEKKKDEDTIKIKKPEFLKKKDEKIKVEKGDKKEEKIIEEKKELDKKAIENIPEDKSLEKEEKEIIKSPSVKTASQKKEKVIPKN
ncbi:60S ribosomal protein L31 [Candidatus Woesearchaeota archaeon]|nr:60S ribosomal protein L31 [Candidatus Woesearchaeota archaeon]